MTFNFSKYLARSVLFGKDRLRPYQKEMYEGVYLQYMAGV